MGVVGNLSCCAFVVYFTFSTTTVVASVRCTTNPQQIEEMEFGACCQTSAETCTIDVRLMRSHSQRDEKSISGHRSSREQQSTHVNQRVNISAGCFKDARDLCAAAVIRTTGNYSPARTTLLESARIFPTLYCIKHSARRSADDLSLIVASPSVRRRELG